MKINYELESFQQCKIFLLQGTDNWIMRQLLVNFCQKRNATLTCCVNEISQNLQKELFSSLINNHHNKVHQDVFWKATIWTPSPQLYSAITSGNGKWLW